MFYIFVCGVVSLLFVKLCRSSTINLIYFREEVIAVSLTELDDSYKGYIIKENAIRCVLYCKQEDYEMASFLKIHKKCICHSRSSKYY